MTMEEKNEYVVNYINSIKDSFESSGHPISDETVSRVTNQYLNSNKSFEEIKEEIDKLVEQKLEELKRQQEFIEKMKKEIENKRIDELNLNQAGITLNEQDIDLMMIANAKTPADLQEALNKITNIRETIPSGSISDADFIKLREDIYNSYMDSLTSRNEYYKNEGISLSKKIEYLRESGVFNNDELAQFNSILQNGKGNINKILSDINSTFSSEKVHQIFQTMKDYSPIEKSGVLGTDIATYQKMFQEIQNGYNSITLDEFAKRGGVSLQDGTFDFKHLDKALEFAKSTGKQVRLNTLLFYMDCPEQLYSLEKTPENKVLVKQELLKYVDAVTSHVRDGGYNDVVRSIDVFNELLNRFAMDGEEPYKYRGDIEQNPNVRDFDNIKSGWLKHLDIDDLCDVIAVARKNLPNMDFMYNDDNLVDPRKMPATIQLLQKIREYEIKHNVKLIDSIGTQMHIDNNVSKEAIIRMFDNLSRFGLPIEVTEFDLAMTSVDGLSEDEIQNLRIQRMNEFYESISECKDRDNIRGVTIWSKTDRQNFRVSLENEIRIHNGLQPIETLHGGFYNDDMSMKTQSQLKQGLKFEQGFNFHTHTYRSGHGQYCTDSEIVESAKKSGITSLGFSEHIPNPDTVLPDEDHRMLLSEVEGYVSSISQLKQQHPEMTILSGFEAEFDPMKEAFLGEMREKVDYMILGQHFVPEGLRAVQGKGDPNYPIKYATMVSKAIDSGLFDIVAHPDVFMQFRDTMIDDESRKLFDENSILASQIICEKARDMGIPIEINLGPATNKEVLSDGSLAFPHPTFWKVASEIEGLKVLQGIDAHYLEAFEKAQESSQLVSNITEMVKDKIVDKNYDPKQAREKNSKLQEALKNGQANALTFETHLVSQMMNGISSNLPDGLSPEETAMGIGTAMNGIEQQCVQKANDKDKKVVEELSAIAENPGKNVQEAKMKVERKKETMTETNRVLANQQGTIERAKTNVVNAVNIGCEKKSEFSNMVTQMTQHNSTKSPEQKSKIESHVSSFQQTKTGVKTNTQTKDKPKQLVRVNNSPNNGSKGYANPIILALIVAFVIGIGVGIGYMIYKINIGG